MEADSSLRRSRLPSRSWASSRRCPRRSRSRWSPVSCNTCVIELYLYHQLCRRACRYGLWMAHPLPLRHGRRGFHRRARIFHAVSLDRACLPFLSPRLLLLCLNLPNSIFDPDQACACSRTSAGLYYFSAKLAPPRYAALASWITGWANVTGQVTLVCSIDFTWYVSVFPSLVGTQLY